MDFANVRGGEEGPDSWFDEAVPSQSPNGGSCDPLPRASHTLCDYWVRRHIWEYRVRSVVARASGVADPVGFGVDPVCRLAQEVSVTSDEVSLATDEAAVEMRRGRRVKAPH